MSLGTSNRDGGRTSEAGHLRPLYAAFGSGVLSGLKVSQRGAGANLSVDVAIGDSIIGRSDLTYGHASFNDAVYNQVISAADVSNPRRDIVVMYIDYGQAPSTAVSNNTNGVVKIKTVNGTPAGSPSDPSDVAIQASVGSGNPWIKLARVAVAAGASSITNSVITDLRTIIAPRSEANAVLQASETIYPHVTDGLVWSGDAYNSTRNASMTVGAVYINGRRLPVALVSARAFTASRDTYVDVLDNLDGTATLVYTEVTNNAASPALAANSIRIAIIITGASSIVNVGSINQGQFAKVLPIASSVPYAFTDSLGNIICGRDPQRKTIGYRQNVTGYTTTSVTSVAATGMLCPFKVPKNRKYKMELWTVGLSNTAGNVGCQIGIKDPTLVAATYVLANQSPSQSAFGNAAKAERALDNDTSSELALSIQPTLNTSAGTINMQAGADYPAFVKVTLE